MENGECVCVCDLFFCCRASSLRNQSSFVCATEETIVSTAHSTKSTHRICFCTHTHRHTMAAKKILEKLCSFVHKWLRSMPLRMTVYRYRMYTFIVGIGIEATKPTVDIIISNVHISMLSWALSIDGIVYFWSLFHCWATGGSPTILLNANFRFVGCSCGCGKSHNVKNEKRSESKEREEKERERFCGKTA